MPILRVLTNKDLDKTEARQAAKALSRRTAELLGKPEDYVQVIVQGGAAMSFGGTDQATAYAVLQSIGLTEAQCPALSAGLCGAFQALLGVPPKRSYIAFENLERGLIGWDSKTFA